MAIYIIKNDDCACTMFMHKSFRGSLVTPGKKLIKTTHIKGNKKQTDCIAAIVTKKTVIKFL